MLNAGRATSSSLQVSGRHFLMRTDRRLSVGTRALGRARRRRVMDMRAHVARVDVALAGGDSPDLPALANVPPEPSAPTFSGEFDSYRMEWESPPVTISLDLVR